MTTTTHIHIRDLRDRVIDLLAIGQTYPLQDLAVRDEQLTVAFNTAAKIPIEDSQKGVLYQLHDGETLVERTPDGDKGPGVPVETHGSGGTIHLKTYKIKDDITFEILARKQHAEQAVREAYLRETATVKVGLDRALTARIILFRLDLEFETQLNPGKIATLLLEQFRNHDIFVSEDAVVHLIKGENAHWRIAQKNGLTYTIWKNDAQLDVYAWLDQTLEKPSDTTPRLIDYGRRVDVQIDNSQEGVDYRLVYFEDDLEIVLSEEVRGDLHDIILVSEPIYEDMDIRIRATKKFDPEDQTDLLDAILPLKVRANTGFEVTVEPTPPIIEFDAQPVIKIAYTQTSAKYKLFIRKIPDHDFVHKTIAEEEVIKVGVAGEPDVQVYKPPRTDIWAPEGYDEAGDFQQGNGGDLQFTLPSLGDDHLVIVQAQKDHQAVQTITSALQLQQAAVVLTHPNPAPSLRLGVLMKGAKTDGQLHVFDGQPGVFYHFRLAPNGADLGRPAYFHKRDETKNINKGLDGEDNEMDSLEIGVDFVIARSLPPEKAGGNPAEIEPEPPLLVTGELDADTVLHVRAIKAQTRVATALSKTATIAALPEIIMEQDEIDSGASTKILVKDSHIDDKYEPWLKGKKFMRALNGTGTEISFNTGVLTEDTEFEMHVTRPKDTGIPVERVVKLLVAVKPEST